MFEFDSLKLDENQTRQKVSSIWHYQNRLFLSWHKCYLYSAKSLTNDVQVDHGVGQQMWNSHLDYLDLSCWSIQLMEHDPINCRMTHLIRLASWEAKHKTEYSLLSVMLMTHQLSKISWNWDITEWNGRAGENFAIREMVIWGEVSLDNFLQKVDSI